MDPQEGLIRSTVCDRSRTRVHVLDASGECEFCHKDLILVAYDDLAGGEPRSGYGNETLRQAGQRQADAVLGKLQRGEINEDTPYAKRTLHLREFTLAGGGPGFDVSFIVDPSVDDEVLEGWFTYYEAANVRIPMRLGDAMTLYEALNQPREWQ